MTEPHFCANYPNYKPTKPMKPTKPTPSPSPAVLPINN